MSHGLLLPTSTYLVRRWSPWAVSSPFLPAHFKIPPTTTLSLHQRTLITTNHCDTSSQPHASRAYRLAGVVDPAPCPAARVSHQDERHATRSQLPRRRLFCPPGVEHMPGWKAPWAFAQYFRTLLCHSHLAIYVRFVDMERGVAKIYHEPHD